MAASAQLYANALPQAFAKNINLTSDTLKMALLGSGYTPNLTTNIHWSDISTNEITGTGYIAGGVTLTSPTLTLTAANSWATTWAATTGYTYGTIIRPVTGNGFLYRCVGSGTSGSSAPTFPTTAGVTVADATVTWACLGDAALVFSTASATWTTATFSASYAVIYDAQTGVSTTEPLLVLNTFGSSQSPSGVNFTVSPDPVLGWFVFSPPA
jgi:hypothetical protein